MVRNNGVFDMYVFVWFDAQYCLHSLLPTAALPNEP